MMKKKEIKENSMGGLLLLLSLLIIHALCNIFNVGTDVIVLNNRKCPTPDRSEITAFQKITLGIPLSVNQECLEGLVAVPGIGPSIAGLIVRERKNRGYFKRLDEIMCIRGIGPGLYKRIKPYLIL